MKIIRFIPFLIAVSSTVIAQAQFPQVAEIDTTVFPLRSLGSGMKFIEQFQADAPTRTIYDQGLSVYRVLHYPAPPPGMTWANMLYITEELFDTDPATIEFTLVAAPIGTPTDFATFVYREDGTQLFEQNPGSMVGSIGISLTGFEPIYTYEGQTYMVLYDHFVFSPPTRIYVLPGTLPCMDCQGSPGENGSPLGGIGTEGAGTRVMVFPNPAQRTATVLLNGTPADAVTLWDGSGKLVRAQAVGTGPSITFSLEGLAQGSYVVSVERQGRRIIGLPLVVEGGSGGH